MVDELQDGGLPPPEEALEAAADAAEPKEAAPPAKEGEGEAEAEDKGLAHLAALKEIDPDLYEELVGAIEAKAAAKQAEEEAARKAAEKPEERLPGDDVDEQVDNYEFRGALRLSDQNVRAARDEYQRVYDDFQSLEADLREMEANGETETKAYRRLAGIHAERLEEGRAVLTSLKRNMATREFMEQVKEEAEDLGPALKGYKTLYAALRLGGQIPSGAPAGRIYQIMNGVLTAQGKRPLGGGKPLLNNVRGEEKKAAVERLKALRLGLGRKTGAAPGRPRASASKLPASLLAKLEEL